MESRGPQFEKQLSRIEELVGNHRDGRRAKNKLRSGLRTISSFQKRSRPGNGGRFG